MSINLKLPESSEAETTQTTWPASDFDYLQKYLGTRVQGFPDRVRWKVALISRYIRHLGDAVTEDKLFAFERSLSSDYLEDVCTAWKNRVPLPTPYADGLTTPCTGLRGSNRHPTGTSSGGSGTESDDAYPAVLFQVANRWRAIVCRDGIQYVLQYRTSPTQPCRWRGKSYPVTRDGLRESIQRLVGQYACEAVNPQVDELPEHVSAWELPAEKVPLDRSLSS